MTLFVFFFDSFFFSFINRCGFRISVFCSTPAVFRWCVTWVAFLSQNANISLLRRKLKCKTDQYDTYSIKQWFFGSIFVFVCLSMSRGQLHLTLSFLVTDNNFLFLLIFFSFSITRLRNHDFVLLLFGTQKQNCTTLRLPENIFLTLFNHSGVNNKCLFPGFIHWKGNQEGKSLKKESSRYTLI